MAEMLNIRLGTVEDVPIILKFIQELAEYEKLSHECLATEESLTDTLFGSHRFVEVRIAEWGDEPVGFCLFFFNYSTFLSKPGIYLEDLYVRPQMRGKGIGKSLLAHLAAYAVERGCGRLEWSVLDWNTPSIEFYKSQGAVPKDEWTMFQVAGESLKALGTSS